MRLEMISRYPDIAAGYPPLLFLHGSFSDARIWDEYFLPFLAGKGHEVHALSLRGHGRSEGRENLQTWRLADFVADLGQAAAALTRPPVLIGHSMGGMIVQKYLESVPPAAGMVLMGSVPPQGLLPCNLHMAIRHPFLFQQMALFAVLGPNYGSLDTMRKLLFSPDMPTEKLHRFFQYVQAESQVVSLDMMGLNPLRLKPGPLSIPTLVLGAQHDIFVSPALVQETGRFYRAECHIFPNMAHAMMLEAHWQMVAHYLTDWLTRSFRPQSAAA